MSDLFRTVQVEETNWRDKKVLGVNPNWRKQLVTFKSVLTVENLKECGFRFEIMFFPITYI
jgi:hypothetical protein